MLTMVVMSIMLVLLGAFMTVNRSQLSLLTVGQRSGALERASESIYEYCFYQLEQDKTWGAGKFGSNKTTTSEFMVITQVENSTKLVGTVEADDLSFEVDIQNNISGVGLSGAGVPAGACRLTISVNRAGQKSSHDIQLRTAPLFDSSAVASRHIYVNSNKMTVASRDPLRNLIRSKGGLSAPSADNVEFNPAPNSAEKGIFWANDHILMGGKDLENPTHREEAYQKTQGRFVDHAETNYDIHRLRKSDFEVEDKPVLVLPDGIYTFTESDVAYENDLGEIDHRAVRALERRESVLVDGAIVAGDVKEIWYYDGGLANNTEGPGSEWVLTDGWTDYAVAHRMTTENFQLFGSDLIRADLSDRKIQIKSNVTAKVDGHFGVKSDEVGKVASLEFVDYNGMTDGKVDSGSIDVNGEILIQGHVKGSGKLVASGSISLFPNEISLESDEVSDLAIYSGKDVLIRPPDNYTYAGDVAFRGLVYAEKDVYMGGTNNQNLRVEGAVVARQGAIHLEANSVELTYNPAFLDTLVKKMPDNQVQLERAVWIP